MSKNITYLLGAGASANCLPLIAGLQEGLEEFSSFVITAYNSTYREYIKEYDKK